MAVIDPLCREDWHEVCDGEFCDCGCHAQNRPSDHEFERHRDIPGSCACTGWQWHPPGRRYVLVGGPVAGCPWHGAEKT